MQLTSQNVSDVFMDCLFKDGEDTTEHVAVRGLVRSFGFHPGRLEANKGKIITLLHELPDTFQRDGGGGGSFLQACYDKEGEQWGEHMNMEQLFSLGVAVGAVNEPFPREMAAMLPGGMPYYSVVV